MGLTVASDALSATPIVRPYRGEGLFLTTWRFGLTSNEAAWQTLDSGGSLLDAIEQGIRTCELDPAERSVGLGGRPDRDGVVTLDACIMDHLGNAGSVCAMEGIATPISVARAVMEKTPHIMLAGDGARRFALEQGFASQDLLVEDSQREWQDWLKEARYRPIANIENHDTIGMLGLDADGRLAGGCSTSGMAFKMHGRVGDSPIIGAGLYVDGDVGACTATGHGEEVMRTVGAFRVVQGMSLGLSPQAACEAAVEAIAAFFRRRAKDWSDTQIGFIALNKNGDIGAYALRSGFDYAVRDQSRTELLRAESLLG
ncbi:MAG: glycosylasparaginase [Gammaproteobacteria bacterium]|jgi:N4-(beta-N-acetylglucosaminyl)-L-asparaginase|nr:glycosylasparaginase [Gammaproteobacteria bacterium]